MKSSEISSLRWDQVSEEFTWDGSWRDIYIFGASSADWQVLLDMVREMGFRLTYLVDSAEALLPGTVEQVFAQRDSAAPTLHIDLEGLDLACHFFTEEEIEMDLDPRQLNEHRFRRLLQFVAAVGDRLEKDVELTYENAPEHSILRYAHDLGRVEVTAAG